MTDRRGQGTPVVTQPGSGTRRSLVPADITLAASLRLSLYSESAKSGGSVSAKDNHSRWPLPRKPHLKRLTSLLLEVRTNAYPGSAPLEYLLIEPTPGGTAGLMVAGRLARADPSLEVLVIEAGIDVRDHPQVVNAALFFSNLMPESTTAAFYQSKASEHVNGREVVVPTGGCLGGGSSINAAMYARGLAIDYDDWETDGWQTKDLLPLMKKTENYLVQDGDLDQDVHGFAGEFKISRGTFTGKRFVRDLLQNASSLGVKEVPDIQNLKEGNAISQLPMWVDPETGVRQNVPHSLIYPILDDGKAKLDILTECKVVRILFSKDKKATGVEYIPNKPVEPGVTPNPVTESQTPTPKLARARKLVILSAGALASPMILERSGIGRATLSKLGIKLVSEVDGVGDNYQDHPFTASTYSSHAEPGETLDGLYSGRLPMATALEQKRASPSTSILGWNGVDVAAKLRPSEIELTSMGADVQAVWNKEYRSRESRPMMLSCFPALSPIPYDQIPVGQYFTVTNYTAYPLSRGSIHITGPSINDKPDFDTGFLSHPVDVTVQVWAYKKLREMVRRLNLYKGPVGAGHPKFPSGSPAGLDHEVPLDQDIEYSPADDEAIAHWVRDTVGTAWHSMGTCAMRPLHDGGVVDKDLNVYGVKGLKVAGMLSLISMFADLCIDRLQICPSVPPRWAPTPTQRR